jgi:hypothetical protein
VDTDADKDMLHVSKEIMQSPVLKELKTFDGEIRTWINQRALPSVFKAGVYLWPILLVVDADEYLQARITLRQELVEKFILMYAAARADAQVRLGSLYDQRDYPDVQKIRESFGLSYQFIECSTPGRLAQISPAMFEREREKAAGIWSEALQEATGLLRSEMADLVAHMAERLQPGPDGKPKVFRNTLVENFTRFLTLFDARNIADDTELQAVVSECKGLLTGVDAQTIRDNDGLRASLAASMQSVKASLDASGIVVKGSRRIKLDMPDDSAAVMAESPADLDAWGDEL